MKSSKSYSRKMSVRRANARLLACAGAVAGLAGASSTAHADLSGFSGFAAPNYSGTTVTPGYSANGSTFNTTDGNGGEAVNGFSPNAQLVTSFDASYLMTTTAGTSGYMADGASFILSNVSNGTATAGAGGGGVGYGGIGSSAALQTEFYGYVSNGTYFGYTTFGTNGTLNGARTPTLTLLTAPQTQLVQVNLEYYGSTLTATETNLTNKQTSTERYTGVNIPALVGGSQALIGLGAGTGGLNMGLNFSSFSYTAAPTFSPIALASSSFNQEMVVPKTAPQTGAASYVTATFDSGATTPISGATFYEQGYNPTALTTGLPASGSTFTSQGDTSHVFTMANYSSGNNALLLGANAASTGTLTLSTPKAYRELSLLATSGDGDQPLSVTIHFSDTAAAITIPDIAVQDWFGGGVEAWNASGRTYPSTGASTYDSAGSGNPNLWEVDFNVPDTTDPIASITLTTDGGGGRTGIFALSGATVVAQGNLTYTGVGAPSGSFDTTGTSLNFQNNGTAVSFANGNSVLFDDTATGTTTVSVQSGGVSPALMTFNNSAKSYTFNGGGISALGVSFNGSGSVTFNDALTVTGGTAVNAGTVTIGSTGTLTSGTVSIGTAGTLAVAAGGQILAAPPISDNGNLTLSTTATTIGALTGNGVVTLHGTTFTVGAGTAFTGTFAGNGTFNLSGGQYNVPSASAIYALTGGINVGTTAVPATLLVTDSSGATGQTSTGSPLTLTLGGAGTLAGPASYTGGWGGNIVLAASTGVATIAAGAGGTGNVGGTFVVSTPITGVGPLAYAGTAGNSNYSLNSTSTYTGETRLMQPPGNYDINQVTLGTNNAISPNSGVNYVASGTGAVILEMNGYNQSVAYLTGNAISMGITASALQNGGNQATLTISNGSTGSGPGNFIPTIQGSINILKTGTGNQILSGTNTYSGTTTITGGTLSVANSQALSNSTVTLGGGKLNLTGITSQVAPNITSFANFQVNVNGANNNNGYNGATLPQNTPYVSSDNTTLQITSNDGGEANSAFLQTPVALPAAGFYANFTYLNDEGADGIAFVLQNDARGASAVGGTGGSLGYGNNGQTATVTSISPSAAIQINIYNGGGTGFGTNGVISDTTAIGNIAFGSDETAMNVSIVYNALSHTVTETVTDPSDGTSGTITYAANYSTILGGTSAYVGFTGGTGGDYSSQAISNFSFGALANGPVSIANAIVTTPNTSSGIELHVAPGLESASVGSLNITSGSKVALDSVVAGSSTRGVLIIPTLTIDSTGTLDIQNNDLDLPGATLSTVTALVKSGYNLTGGAKWNGTGITSSTAGSDTTHLTAVGVIMNATTGGSQLYGSGTTLGLFDGSNPGYGDVLVKYTYFGDANLDGKVDGSDYSLIDGGYASHGALTGWYNGDFNYDGVIDGSDYALIDNAFNNQGASQLNTAALVATETAEVAPSSAVPEPASLGLLAVAGLAMARRRSRR